MPPTLAARNVGARFGALEESSLQQHLGLDKGWNQSVPSRRPLVGNQTWRENSRRCCNLHESSTLESWALRSNSCATICNDETLERPLFLWNISSCVQQAE